eukprot:5306923-Lingulodinium_polyedra.AAC.1
MEFAAGVAKEVGSVANLFLHAKGGRPDNFMLKYMGVWVDVSPREVGEGDRRSALRKRPDAAP